MIQKEDFDRLANALFSCLHESEELSLYLHAEDSDFLRLNRSRVRQNTSLLQMELSCTWTCNKRRWTETFPLVLSFDQNFAQYQLALSRARQMLNYLPEDPYCQKLENN